MTFPDDPQPNSEARNAVTDYLSAFDDADYLRSLRRTCTADRPALKRLGREEFERQAGHAVSTRGRSEVLQSVVSEVAAGSMNVVVEIGYSKRPTDSTYNSSVQRVFELREESDGWTVCGYTDLDDPAYRN